MKKIYINPTLLVVTISTTRLMMNSLPVDPNKETTTQMARQNFFGGWDDDVEPGEDY